MQLVDSLTNFMAELGTRRDKASHSTYTLPYENSVELENAYRGAWLPRKIVDIPANDATREWRAWQAESGQIAKIEAEEKRLGLKSKVNEALKKSRLFGGAAIYIGIALDDPSKPIIPERVSRIDFLTVMSCNDVTAGPNEDDPFAEGYGKPKYYESNGKPVHPSRLCIFYGAKRPGSYSFSGTSWGDSILTAMMDTLKNVDSAMANINSLIFEAKIDVLKIPDLNGMMKDDKKRAAIVSRVGVAAALKGNNGMLVIDGEEEHTSKSFAFANLDNIGMMFLQVAAGSADIPATRLIGMSPGGLNASGESDYRNYIDKVTGIQENDIGTAIQVLDECILYSAIGSRPEEVYYEWRPLWQPSAKERADLGKTVADTIAVLAGTALIPEDALAKAAINMLTEHEIMPGLEQEVENADI